MPLAIDELYSEIQARLDTRLALVIGTGCSMSIHSDFGMWALENHLHNCIPNLIDSDTQAKSDWERVKEKRKSGSDFENALNEVKSDFLLSSIIKETGIHVTNVSIATLHNIHCEDMPIMTLLDKLKHLLSSSHPALDIITPNYDLIIENALSRIGIPYSDGFYGEYVKSFNWTEAKNCFIRLLDSGKRKGGIQKMIPFVRLHKVHGSLNYFIQKDDVVRIDALSYFPTSSFERFIITPGESKHKKIVQNRSFYSEMDKCIGDVNSFLFIGYGFNDIDIDKKICGDIVSKGRKAIIVTKEITSDKGKALLENPNNIIIMDNRKGGATIYFNNEELNVDKPIWQIEQFTQEIL